MLRFPDPLKLLRALLPSTSQRRQRTARSRHIRLEHLESRSLLTIFLTANGIYSIDEGESLTVQATFFDDNTAAESITVEYSLDPVFGDADDLSITEDIANLLADPGATVP